MDCPKCGATQEAGREECSACGVIFARWLERLDRIQLGTPTPIPDEPIARALFGNIPPWAIVVVIFWIGFGLIWTVRRHAHAKEEPVDVVNEINNKDTKERLRLRAEAENAARAVRARQQAEASQTALINLPDDLDETSIRNLIGGCSNYFQQPVTTEIPRRFERAAYSDLLTRYPAFAAAAREGLIEFDPSFDINGTYSRGSYRSGEEITVKLTPAAFFKADALDAGGDAYQLRLGKRNLSSIKVEQVSESAVTVQFQWNYERPTGDTLLPNGHSGTAQLHRTASGWAAAKVSVTDSIAHSHEDICSN